MLYCSKDCYAICDFCLFYDFNGEEINGCPGVYTGKGVCWHPKHPERKDPGDNCSDFICFQVIK